jgi:hypothetical protein
MSRKIMVLGLVLTVALTCLLAVGASAQAIQFGQPDGDDHPYVCLVVFYDAQDQPLWRTTGELISPTVVVTAGHGTFGTTGARVWFLKTIPASSQGGYPYGGPDAYRGTPSTNPQYRSTPLPGLPGFDYHDVGVVVLDEIAPVTQFASLPEPGVVGTLSPKDPIDIVGYGVNYREPGGGLSPYDQWRWARERYYAPCSVIETRSALAGEFLKLSANPAQGKGGGTFGDSGGPALQAGTDVVLAITAFGTNTPCMGTGYYQRLDIPDILDWIGDFVD